MKENEVYEVIYSDRLFMLIESMKEAREIHIGTTPRPCRCSRLQSWTLGVICAITRPQCSLFQVPQIEALAELLMRHDYMKLREQRERFLWELYC